MVECLLETDGKGLLVMMTLKLRAGSFGCAWKI